MHTRVLPSLLAWVACLSGFSSLAIAASKQDGEFSDLISRLAERPGNEHQILAEPGVHNAVSQWSGTAGNAPKSPGEQWLLGVLYQFGIGRAQSPANANALFVRACEANFAPACFTLSETAHLSGDAPQMESRLRQAAQYDYVPAMNNLGFLLVMGDGVPARPDEGIQWLERAAAADPSKVGSAASMCNIGWLYLGKTKGVAQDLDKAISWLSRASSNSYVKSTNLLGIAYLLRNEPGDAARSRQAFEQASEMGSDQAKVNLAVLYERGWGVQRDRTLRQSARSVAQPFTSEYEFPQGSAR